MSMLDLTNEAQACLLAHDMGFYSDDDVIDWADKAIAALDAPAPGWLCDIWEHRLLRHKQDWGGMAEAPSELDVVLARVPREFDVARVLSLLFDIVLDRVRRQERSAAQAMSSLYGLMFKIELPQELKREVYLLDYHLGLLDDGIGTMDQVHQRVVDFLTRHTTRDD